MKIERLVLRSYGPFVEHELDLSGGSPGLHLIHGPNEAGKTVTRRAIADALFGMGTATHPYGFLAGYDAMALEATLSLASGESTTFLRKRARGDPVLQPGSTAPYPADHLSRYLGSLTRDSFVRVHSLDHASLSEGGETLRALEGLAGESLFAASVGVSGLDQVLQNLEQEVQNLWRKRKSSATTMQQARRDFEAVRKDLRAARSSIGAWNDLRRAVRSKRGEVEKLETTLRELRVRKSWLEQLQAVLELLPRRDALREQLASYADDPALPAGYSRDRREKATVAERDATRMQDEACRALDGSGTDDPDGLRARLAALSVPGELLARSGTIASLYSRVEQYRVALRDRPRVEARAAGRKARLAEIAAGLETRADSPGENPADLADAVDPVGRLRAWIVTDTTRKEVGELGGDAKSVADAPARLQRDRADLVSSLEEVAREIESLGEVPDAGPLERALARARSKGDLEEALRSLESRNSLGLQALDRDRAALGRFHGTLDRLIATPWPEVATLEAFRADFRKIEDDTTRLDGLERAANDRKKAPGTEFARRAEGALPTADDLQEARDARDHAWLLVRARWLDDAKANEVSQAHGSDGGLAEHYGATVRAADEVSDGLREHADEVAQAEARADQLAEIERELEGLGVERGRLDVERSTLDRRWTDLWAAVEVGEPGSPTVMIEWLGRVMALRNRHAELAALDLERNAARDDVARHRAEVGSELATLELPSPGEDETLAALLDRAQTSCAALSKQANRFETLLERQSDLEDRAKKLDREIEHAEAEAESWRDRWRAALVPLRLDPGSSAAVAQERIDKLAKAATEIEGLDEDSGRIEDMTATLSSFEADLAKVVSAAAPDLDGLDPAEAVVALHDRVAVAETNRTKQGGLEDSIETQEIRLREAGSMLAAARAELNELAAQVGTEDPTRLPAIEQRAAEKAQLEKDLAATDDSLRAIARGTDPGELVELAGKTSAAEIEVELREIAAKVEPGDRRVAALREELGAAERDLRAVDGTDAAARLDEQALALVSRIQEDGRAYTIRHLAVAILKDQIERHRAENQDPMITRAGELFTRLCRGSFIALDVDHGADPPVIVGRRPGSTESVGVEAFSDGTADQLYLALRLAYLERALEGRAEPIPMIADDVLVDFDDVRAAVTLEVLGELAQRTQVLLLTHHSHVRDLALRTLPDDVLFVHELPGPNAPHD